MKRFFYASFSATTVLCLFFAAPFVTSAQVLFTQDFSESTTISTYVGSGVNQFDFIGVNSTGASSVYATGNRLNLQRNTNAVGFARTTNLSATTPTILKVKFKLSVPFSSTTMATATAAVLYVGSSLVAGATTTGELASNASRHSSLLIGFAAASGTFNLRTPAFVTSGNYTGEQEISWYINNSGASINYIDPAGNSTALGNDKNDIWVGTTRIFNDVAAVTATQDLNNVKLLFNNGAANSAIAIDDIEISTGSNVVLPVSLTNFTAQKTGTTNQLAWTTETETHNTGYDIQRQTATGKWESLGFVKGMNTASTYTFEDKTPFSISYYRLRQVDYDGKETFSKIVSVSQDGKGQMHISPNPTSDKITIHLTQNDALNAITTAVLFDMTGKQVLNINTKSEVFPLDLSDLAKGMYILQVQSNHAVYQEKIIRQ
ncbi:MAG: T9SS type A sorting domain-containing protein [Saprospiraceae bacterium]|nr:T9SS type A sorting domain-containing protein [Saprospiraceae bacterium]